MCAVEYINIEQLQFQYQLQHLFPSNNLDTNTSDIEWFKTLKRNIIQLNNVQFLFDNKKDKHHWLFKLQHNQLSILEHYNNTIKKYCLDDDEESLKSNGQPLSNGGIKALKTRMKQLLNDLKKGRSQLFVSKGHT